MDLLLSYSWPGNVRELRTAIEHAVVLCRGQKLVARDLPAAVRNAQSPPEHEAVQLLAGNNLSMPEAEKQLIIRALKDTNGNRTLAAKKLGLSRRTLHRKLHEYQIDGV
jgi:DNA-binding NtrC family response regulator